MEKRDFLANDRRRADDERLTTLIQSHFLNIVRHGWLDEAAKRLSGGGVLANCG
jgi:hypothetical protein